MRRLLPVVFVAALAGCSGTLRTEPFDAANFTTDGNDEAIDGVIHYAPAYVRITYEYTMRVEDGKVVGYAKDGDCIPTKQKEEVRILPNFHRAYRVYQDPGFLSSNKFSVTLSNGMLTAVGSESAPQGPAAVTSLGALASGVAAFALPGAEQTPTGDDFACNASPEITEYTPVDPFKDASTAVSLSESGR